MRLETLVRDEQRTCVLAKPMFDFQEWKATVDAVRPRVASRASILSTIALVSMLHAAPATGAVLFMDDFNRPNSLSLGSPWTEVNELTTGLPLPGGFNVDPGYIEIDNNTMAFHYVRETPPFDVIHSRAYAYAPLAASTTSGRLSFTYQPHQNARVLHEFGFMAGADGFTPAGSIGSYTAVYETVTSVGFILARTDSGLNNSQITLVTNTGGIRTVLVTQPLSFQLDSGTTYSLAMNWLGDQISVEIHSGSASDEVSASLAGFSMTADQIFVNDLQGGTSFSAANGEYIMRLDDFLVTVPAPTTIACVLMAIVGFAFVRTRRQVTPQDVCEPAPSGKLRAPVTGGTLMGLETLFRNTGFATRLEGVFRTPKSRRGRTVARQRKAASLAKALGNRQDHSGPERIAAFPGHRDVDRSHGVLLAAAAGPA